MSVSASELTSLGEQKTARDGPSFPDVATLAELFEIQADARPDALALECGQTSFTYGELDQKCNRLARHLQRLGIGPGVVVGLYLDRSELPIIAILGVLKAGGAYLPIDPAHPQERVRYIIEEAAVATVLTERALLPKISELYQGELVLLDDADAIFAASTPGRLTPEETQVSPSDLCYVLYTSGTTGRPKGVMAEHRNVYRFALAFNKVCNTTPQDRIFQGFALGFDGSVEEIWMAFSNGAALVLGNKETPRFGNDLARFLAQKSVSYFSTVPTMLSTMTDDIPSLRQVVVSGEVCPPELVARWAKPGRLMLNVYGPTEATVNSTAFVCEPGRPITIGRPLLGYEAYVLDEQGNILPSGGRGELVIGGVGVSRGYLNRPDLSEKAFLVTADGRRLYRTGDLASFNDRGEIEFFGRIDDQVKIRGYRVELSEIESVLLEQSNIASAAVKLVDRDGMPGLAAYIVLENPKLTINRSAVLAALRARLPAYMIPAYLDQVGELPLLVSGKVDRKSLPPANAPLVDALSADDENLTHLEAELVDVWAAVFALQRVGIDQDFFLDLGGHSLLAAQMTAMLRGRTDLPIAVRDVYAHPTVRQLATHIETTHAGSSAKSASAAQAPSTVSIVNRCKPSLIFVMAQIVYLLALIPILTLPIVVALPPVIDILYFRRPIVPVLLFLIALGLALWLVLLVVALGAKWLIIGRYRPGAYPLWGSYYLRWWIVSRLIGLSGLGVFGGTPLAPLTWRMLGAKVGRNCVLQTGQVSAWDCITIGDDVSIAADTQLMGVRVENGLLLIGTIDIGDRCFVGIQSVLGLNVKMGADCRLDDQSLLPDGETMQAGEYRRGSPAVEAPVAVPEGEPIRCSRLWLLFFTIAQLSSAATLAFLFALPGIAMGLGWGLLIVNANPVLWLPVIAVSVPVLIVVGCFWLAACKFFVFPNPRPGTYRGYSFKYLQFWLASGLMRAARAGGLLIFTTIFLPPWMRLLGAKLGKHTEMSTVWSLFPDLLKAGDGVFFADGCILGGSRTYLGRFAMMENHIGNRSFIGNSAILPPGAGLGDNCLLGVLSSPPDPTTTTPDGTDWLGSPGFRLPNRQKLGNFDEHRTYRPTIKLYLQRAVVDALRILIPAYLGTILAVAGFLLVLNIYNSYGAWRVWLCAPLIGWMGLAIAVAVVVLLKWVIMGRFKPTVVPLWSAYVWFNEMINGIYEAVMGPVVAGFFGTPFAAPLLRLMGCKIGKHCYIATNLFSEFDLVNIGDYVALNPGVVIQNHLFEDRVMKSSYIRIGDGCSIGNKSVVLYDTLMQDQAVLGPLSLLMKGEVMPSGSYWHGIPTVQG